MIPFFILLPVLAAALWTGAKPPRRTPSIDESLQLVTFLFVGWGAAEFDMPPLGAASLAVLGWVLVGKDRLSSPLLPSSLMMGGAIAYSTTIVTLGNHPIPFPLLAVLGALSAAAWSARKPEGSFLEGGTLRALVVAPFLFGLPYLYGVAPVGYHLLPLLPAAAAAWVWAIRGKGNGLYWALALSAAAWWGGYNLLSPSLSPMRETGVLLWATLLSLLLWGLLSLVRKSPDSTENIPSSL
ncbi:hypothetical protein H8D30_06600 [bacterium]|nr:hypothetical protein [bacterium]